MGEIKVPSLVDLCIYSIRDELIQVDDLNLSSVLYRLPTELFDQLLLQLPPLALQKLQQGKSVILDDHELLTDGVDNQRKRKRYLNFEEEWKNLYEARWPAFGWRSKNFRSQSSARSANQKEVECESANDWQQMYWEAHLQNCLDTAAELTLFPSFHGRISEIEVPESILNYIDHRGGISRFTCDYSKFAYHCQQFGSYARCIFTKKINSAGVISSEDNEPHDRNIIKCHMQINVPIILSHHLEHCICEVSLKVETGVLSSAVLYFLFLFFLLETGCVQSKWLF